MRNDELDAPSTLEGDFFKALLAFSQLNALETQRVFSKNRIPEIGVINFTRRTGE